MCMAIYVSIRNRFEYRSSGSELNLFLNAYINRHVHAKYLKMILFYSPFGIRHVFLCSINTNIYHFRSTKYRQSFAPLKIAALTTSRIYYVILLNRYYSYWPNTLTLTLAYLSCEFAFRAHFQCVVRTYDLKCVENANQLVSTQGKIHEYSYVLGSVSALTNQNCLFRKIDIGVC